MMERLLILILALFSFSQAQAAEASVACLNGQEVRDIQSQLKVNMAEPLKDLCARDSHGVQIFRILNLLKKMQISAAPLEGRYNQNIVGTDFWGFLTKRIRTVSEAPAEDTRCARGAMAYVDQKSSANVAFVCPLFFDNSYSDYEKASVLLHEARHVEGHAHVMCLAGNKVANSGGCDERIEDKGAYAVTIETMAKMALRGINIPLEERQKIRLNLLNYLESFNELVNGVGNSGIYLQSQDGKQAFLYDGAVLTPAPTLAKTHLVSRGLSLIAVPVSSKADGFGVDVFRSKLDSIPAVGGCILDYNKLPLPERRPLVDIVADGAFSACIYENTIVGRIGNGKGADARATIPGKIRSVFTSEEIRDANQDSFFVKTSKKEFFRVRFTEKETFEVTKVKDPAVGFGQLFFFNSDLTGLTEDGRLMKIDFETNDWVLIPGLEKMRFKSSTRPFLWSQDLVE
jgi:hypothetical protein